MKRRSAIAVLSIALIAVALGGCAASTPSTGKESPAKTAPAPKPADLTGAWEQSNKNSNDTYQKATITADSIEVDWVTDGGGTTSLYWAGSYTPPTKAGAFSWDSTNDTSKTGSSMLASSDPTKTFTYDGSKISYKVSALGVTTTVELSRK